MGSSRYLIGAAELEEYGVPTATPVEIMRASSLVDHYLQRPKGCVWNVDSDGIPIYMAGANPTMSYTSNAIIYPGTEVAVQLQGFTGHDDSIIQDVIIIDRGIKSITDAVIVERVIQPNTVVFKAVYNMHDGTQTPITFDRGLVIDEERPLPGQRSVTRMAEWPIVNVHSAVGRYGYGRRSDQKLGYFYDVNLLSTLSAFGGPPTWNAFAIEASSINPNTGDMWVPAGLLLAYYTDIKVRYIGGWSQPNLPSEIKLATATLIERIRDAPMGPMVRRFNTGKISIDRFADTVIDPDIKSLLRPYQANWMI